jgi:hypothetical protein
MAEQVKPRRRRAVVLAVPAALVAVLAVIALMRVGGPDEREPGAAGTMGVNDSREASIDRVEVRQLTSDRTFWAGEIDEPPLFVVAQRPVNVQPGAYVSIVGRMQPAPSIEVAEREWRVDEATARAVHQRGSYLRATSIEPSR